MAVKKKKINILVKIRFEEFLPSDREVSISIKKLHLDAQ